MQVKQKLLPEYQSVDSPAGQVRRYAHSRTMKPEIVIQDQKEGWKNAPNYLKKEGWSWFPVRYLAQLSKI